MEKKRWIRLECFNNELGGIFDFGSKASAAAGAVSAAASEAVKTLQQGQQAIQQGREVISTASNTAADMDAYVQRIQNIPIEQLAARFDFKSNIAVEELLSLSAFMKKSLIYLAGMATLSVYLNIITKQ